ncbi:glyoxylate/hydroxypyruvate reductase A [Kaustia mangrovi]|uniref:Glyoxylate/hydroxypyruvate reductase A n=1 Tax=Kaustia mangrovi TaxID=2593653 RepID=A0A7S8HCL5_9HYPH|nr:glyoxylate/hydroxypyruvate reductase A [Kaustia mangrovi]QPC43857.1 glyoxylate/hydroxypyruvate reductase A [Kaustia mangrovi]
MAILYLISGWQTDHWVSAMRELAPERDVRLWPDAGALSEIDYVLAWKPLTGVFKTLPNLKAIFSLGAGVDAIMADPDLPGVPVARIVDPDLTMRMTEYVVLHVLMHHRQQRRYDAVQARREWRPLDQPPANAVRVGIMGLGALGRDAAEKLRDLGFDVAGWSRSPKRVEGVACFAGDDGLKPFLARTDILVCLLPHTPETEGLIDRKLIAGLARDGAIEGPALINAARGKLQVEADILAALDDGTLAHATLDVFETEPLPQESPFWTHPRVTLTPHVASDSDPLSLTRNILAQIERFEAGQPLENLVDRNRGY